MKNNIYNNKTFEELTESIRENLLLITTLLLNTISTQEDFVKEKDLAQKFNKKQMLRKCMADFMVSYAIGSQLLSQASELIFEAAENYQVAEGEASENYLLILNFFADKYMYLSKTFYKKIKLDEIL